MPALRPCNRPRCPELVPKGYCKEHSKKRQQSYDRARGTARQRGYDGAWDRLSKAYRRAHPLCEDCEERGGTTVTDLVHHLDPVEEGNPVVVSWDRLRALCRTCHERWHEERNRVLES